MGAISGLVTKPLTKVSNKTGAVRESLYQTQVKD